MRVKHLVYLFIVGFIGGLFMVPVPDNGVMMAKVFSCTLVGVATALLGFLVVILVTIWDDKL